jgi:hypothetical protein
MPYTAEISRCNPAALVILVDQSGSMADTFQAGNATLPKMKGAADATNRLIHSLALRCSSGEKILDRFHLGLIGYGQSSGVSSLGPGGDGAGLTPISRWASRPARMEERHRRVPDGAGGLVEEAIQMPVWLEPVADGGTPMCSALRKAQELLAPWIQDHPGSFPPIVINITDGDSTEGDASSAMQSLRQMSTHDGNLLLFNLHLSGSGNGQQMCFPAGEESCLDHLSRMLYRGSSPLTPGMLAESQRQGIPTLPGARGFVMNADLVLLIQALEIGTRVEARTLACA